MTSHIFLALGMWDQVVERNEMAVELFRRGDLSFGDIARRVQDALERHQYRPSPSLDEILTLDRWAREEVAKCTTC